MIKLCSLCGNCARLPIASWLLSPGCWAGWPCKIPPIAGCAYATTRAGKAISDILKRHPVFPFRKMFSDCMRPINPFPIHPSMMNAVGSSPGAGKVQH